LFTKYPLFLLQIISLNAHTPRLMKRFQSVNRSVTLFILCVKLFAYVITIIDTVSNPRVYKVFV